MNGGVANRAIVRNWNGCPTPATSHRARGPLYRRAFHAIGMTDVQSSVRKAMRRTRVSLHAMLDSLRFRCLYRSNSHVFVILACGLIYAGLNLSTFLPVLFETALLFFLLTGIAAFDAVYFIIPDIYVLSLMVLGLVAVGFGDLRETFGRLAAAVAAYLLIVGLDSLYRAVRGVSGIGRGDAKLLAAAGLLLGFYGVLTTVLWASVSGLFAASVMRFDRPGIAKTTAIPFGPHLAIGIWLVWLIGPIAPD